MIMREVFSCNQEQVNGLVDYTKKVWEQINKDNWHKGAYFKVDKSGEKVVGCCLIGWLKVRYGRMTDGSGDIEPLGIRYYGSYRHDIEDLVERLGHKVGCGKNLAAWQDNINTTLVHVIDALRELDL